MAFVKIALVVALAVAAFAEPLRYRRSHKPSIIASTGAAAAEGVGSANDAHNAAVIAIGIPASSGNGWGSGWGSDALAGVPASIVISNSGLSEVANDASILEVTSNDGNGILVGLQTVDVGQVAAAGDSLDVDAAGGDIALGSSSDAFAEGTGASAAAGNVIITAS